jgi:outer membrane biosynthesis protein TonB
MRVKKLLAPLGIALAVALAVPSVSDASRGGDDPVLEEEDPVVEEEPTPEPEPEPAPEPDPEPEPAPEPEIEDPVLPQEAPEPRARPEREEKVKEEKVKADKEPCHMDDYEPRAVDDVDFEAGELARAEKVDGNGNGNDQVCRKDIPGNGRGNTGHGSNIKDDQDR